MTQSYVLCGTPRTGSTLLCGLLADTGIAGRPESYFREPDLDSWADRWRLPRDDHGRYDRGGYAAAVLDAGRTSNGVFGCRVMWGSVEVMIDHLGGAERVDDHHRVLTSALGPVRFIHLSRADTVAQAVSWARAEQSRYWQQGDVVAAEPTYDADQIRSLERTITEHNAAWEDWFSRLGVVPYRVGYEHLVADPRRTLAGVLESLGLRLDDDHQVVPRHRRQADRLNEEWVRRYRSA